MEIPTVTQNPNSTPNPNPNNTRNLNPNPAQNPIINIATPNPYAALELEDNEGVQEGGVIEVIQEVEVVTVAPVVTTKQWVANSFVENNVPMNKECAEIPSNTSLGNKKWSDEVEEGVEEGEILNSEESMNSSSPNDPGGEEEGKENHMAITIIPEEVGAQDEPQLEVNSVVEAQPTSIEVEIGTETSQQPEGNVNTGKGQPTAPSVLPTVREEEISSKQKSVSKPKKSGNNDQAIPQPSRNQQGVVLVQCAQSLAGKTIHKDATTLSLYDSQDILQFQIFGGFFFYSTWWKSESFRLRGPHAHYLTFEGNSNRGTHTERWKSEGIRLGGPSLSSWWKFEGIRLGGPHIYWIPFERVRVRGSHTVHHWWEFEVIRLGGPHIYWRTSERFRLRGSHAVYHGWDSKVFRPGGPRIHWVTSEGHRISGLHIVYHWWESEGTRLGGPLTQISTFTERGPEGSGVGGVHTVVLGWTLRLSGLGDHHIDWYGNPMVADLEDHRHRFMLGYTDKQQAHDRLQLEMCSLGELPLTFAHRRQTHDSSEGRKWGDDEEEKVADNEESPGGLQKGKAPMESQIIDDMTESTEDSTAYTAGPRRSRRARNRAAARMTYARK
ncbi:hypothetical protein K7X08_012599 [Anisodus acutangulus]|uniref:Uncharacterized protein n=1 Tax=Anisodus acutangulus TaxID=402998 RepID=A0A9Q1LDG0_9SOLA|nr:hypothetical protein K7X08_012599 [Anisodus acutangulus]